MSSAILAPSVSVFAACFVEMVEATTIVMAMGFTRSWKSALLGTAAALGLLVVVTAILGYALRSWMPESALQLVIGGLLLVFRLQWLRKAILRNSGRKAIHDEDEIFLHEAEAARRAVARAGAFDLLAFMASFKGVFLEGMEVVFIVITSGLNADGVPIAAAGAGAAIVVVLGLALAVGRPLSMINENLLKCGVGLLLATFGTFWVVEGVGVFRPGAQSVSWPGGDLALIAVLGAWLLLSRSFFRALRPAPVHVA